MMTVFNEVERISGCANNGDLFATNKGINEFPFSAEKDMENEIFVR